MHIRIFLTTILSALLLTPGTVLAEETAAQEIQPEEAPVEAATSENAAAEALESVLTMSMADLAALFKTLTDDMSGPVIDELKLDIAEAAETFENQTVFSGSNPDGTQTWNGEVQYYPFLSIFDARVTVHANDYVVDDVENFRLNGSMSIRIAGFWNPIYNGLTSLGFPYITYFSVDGSIASSGFMEEELSVHILIDSSTDPISAAFVVNGHDFLAELNAQEGEE